MQRFIHYNHATKACLLGSIKDSWTQSRLLGSIKATITRIGTLRLNLISGAQLAASATTAIDHEKIEDLRKTQKLLGDEAARVAICAA